MLVTDRDGNIGIALIWSGKPIVIPCFDVGPHINIRDYYFAR